MEPVLDPPVPLDRWRGQRAGRNPDPTLLPCGKHARESTALPTIRIDSTPLTWPYNSIDAQDWRNCAVPGGIELDLTAGPQTATQGGNRVPVDFTVAEDVLAYFDRPRTSNGPTEAITVASSTCAVPLSGSATSPTKSHEHSSRPADSDPDYTLDCEEPLMQGRALP